MNDKSVPSVDEGVHAFAIFKGPSVARIAPSISSTSCNILSSYTNTTVWVLRVIKMGVMHLNQILLLLKKSMLL